MEVFYISQSCFDLARVVRNNTHKRLLFKQALRDVERMYEDNSAYDMAFGEPKEVCREDWSEKFNYLGIDMTKNKSEDKYR